MLAYLLTKSGIPKFSSIFVKDSFISCSFAIVIHHFHIDRNTPRLLRKILHNRCLLFLLGRLCYPGEIGNNSLANFFLEAGGGGANKGCLPFTKRFRKSGWKVNWARLSGSFQRNISGSNRISEEKVVLFFWTGLMFHFFKAIFYTSFRLSLPFFGKCSWFVQMVNEILWRRWPVLNFGYHIPKPWIDRFAHANNKQQLTSEKRDSLGPKLGARAFMGLSGGRACKQTWRKATWNVSAEQNGRWNWQGKKHENVKLKEEDVPGTSLPREKREECTVKQLQRWPLSHGAKTTGKKTQLDTSRLWYSIKCQTRGVPEVICAERHTTTACLVIYSRWLLDLSPQTIP